MYPLIPNIIEGRKVYSTKLIQFIVDKYKEIGSYLGVSKYLSTFGYKLDASAVKKVINAHLIKLK
jgi:hypothetical protein